MCGERVSVRWTLIEGASALIAASVSLRGGSALEVVPLIGFLTTLLALAAIDLEHHRLPNAIVMPLGVVCLLWVGVGPMTGLELKVGPAFIGGAAYGGGLLVISLVSRGGMGMGDVKLAAVIGFVVGALDLASVAVAAGAAFLLGGVIGVVALLRGAGRRSAIPFGPMLAGGAFIAIFWGPSLARGYLSLLRA